MRSCFYSAGRLFGQDSILGHINLCNGIFTDFQSFNFVRPEFQGMEMRTDTELDGLGGSTVFRHPKDQRIVDFSALGRSDHHMVAGHVPGTVLGR